MAKFINKKTHKHQLYSARSRVNRSSKRSKENTFKLSEAADETKFNRFESDSNLVQKNDNSLVSDLVDEKNNSEEFSDSSEQSQKDSNELDLEKNTYKALFHSQKALEMYREKKYDECIFELEKALKLEPGNLEFVYWLGMSHFQLRQFEKAIGYFVKSSHTEDNQLFYREAFFWLGEIYRYREQLEMAVCNYEKFLASSSQSIYAAEASKRLSELKLKFLFDKN